MNSYSSTSLENNDGWTISAAILSLVTSITYSQFDAFLSTLICVVYNAVRTYFWIHPLSKYLRFNLYYSATFILIYIIGRGIHQRERDHFNKLKNQKQLLSLFHKLVRVYHDGIIISSNDKIVLYNKQV